MQVLNMLWISFMFRLYCSFLSLLIPALAWWICGSSADYGDILMHWKPFGDHFDCIILWTALIWVYFVCLLRHCPPALLSLLLCVADTVWQSSRSGLFMFEDKVQVAPCVSFKGKRWEKGLWVLWFSPVMSHLCSSFHLNHVSRSRTQSLNTYFTNVAIWCLYSHSANSPKLFHQFICSTFRMPFAKTGSSAPCDVTHGSGAWTRPSNRCWGLKSPCSCLLPNNVH